ncbi:uncharacterized protein [Halyomorpha halys]|uniref:uncharacterized protein n=1 Tax=Halyomorpha halys TaxID=286706 RepID=UPI0006D4EDA6|nr:uncharacterized protein LOC106691106 isoform X3 [Halyomorpha halys]XP_014292254.1 uncharacterized protein LOC106691106 isoform X3 [Halyomorpha halys]XP_014292255.1 uncharacterized protein LOC106691106 isoform X3 [Halyomorpha halys]XP_014292256.1 uncharacterized protein LOC106691106 isoform X3 [Halyomorpha halys]
MDYANIIEVKCKVLEMALERDCRNKTLEKLKVKKSTLKNTLDLEQKEFNNVKKMLEHISEQRKIFELEKEIENTIDSDYFNSETGESLVHNLVDLIGSLKTMRNSLNIYDAFINSTDQLNDLVIETKLKLEESLESEKHFMNEIVLAKDLPLLNEFLYQSHVVQKQCAEVIGVVERLILHKQALSSVYKSEAN